jgi:hypothetical protein
MGAALGENRTMDEAAAWLRISRRVLQDLVQRHPIYYANGRRKLFSEAHLIALRSAMEQEAQECPSKSTRRGKAGRRTIQYVEPTSGSTLTELQALLNSRKRDRSARESRQTSNVVALPARANPHSQ